MPDRVAPDFWHPSGVRYCHNHNPVVSRLRRSTTGYYLSSLRLEELSSLRLEELLDFLIFNFSSLRLEKLPNSTLLNCLMFSNFHFKDSREGAKTRRNTGKCLPSRLRASQII
jgi:hypothetical protein